ncbi:MAG: lysophospholipid acyltransferase family protein [Nitrospinae bacterium]|nr:lysophospholipid acyltransferase family protein [Nitrospinota bacterium]
MSGKHSSIADRAGYAAVLGLAKLVQSVPRNTALMIGSALGYLLWIFLLLSGRVKVAVENMRNLYPDEDEGKLKTITRKMCLHFGRFIVEAGRLKTLDRETAEQIVTIEGLEILKEAHARGKGVILATAHSGHFEMANGALALLGFPVWSVIRTVDNEGVDRITDDCRMATGLKVIKREHSAMEIIKRVREGGVVTVAVDQNAGFNNIFVPFFGKLCATVVTPAVASLRTGSAVIPYFSFLDQTTGVYTAKFWPEIIIQPTGDRSADIRLITMKINDALEEAIRHAPEQWLWFHKRWKTRPGEKDITAIRRDMEIISASSKTAQVR